MLALDSPKLINNLLTDADLMLYSIIELLYVGISSCSSKLSLDVSHNLVRILVACISERSKLAEYYATLSINFGLLKVMSKFCHDVHDTAELLTDYSPLLQNCALFLHQLVKLAIEIDEYFFLI